MRDLILQSARLRLLRLGLLALGAAAITAGLAFLVGTLQHSQATVMQTMADRWRVSYDILVRPKGIEGTPGYFPPSQLTGGGGGISMQQWEQIKQIAGVEVAAPVTQVGWVDYPVSVPLKAEPGLYRVAWEQSQSDGLQTYTTKGTRYTWVFSPSLLEGTRYEASAGLRGTARTREERREGTVAAALFEQAGIGVAPADDSTAFDVTVTVPVGIVAVDAEAESRLMGLDKAVAGGSYFATGDDRPSPIPTPGTVTYSLPVLVSAGTYGNFNLRVRLERLDLPAEPTTALLNDVVTRGGASAYLATRPGVAAAAWQSPPGRMGELLLARLGASDIQLTWSAKLHQAPRPQQYQSVLSPDPSRWPSAFQTLTAGVVSPPKGATGSPMAAWRFGGTGDDAPYPVRFHLVGTYDPGRVALSTPDDPGAALYRAGGAQVMFDTGLKPLARSVALKPLSHPLAYLTTPPVLLTTLTAAVPLLSPAPIGAVRVRVAGVEQVSDASIAKVDKVAKAIAARTDLQVDILRGASPEPILVNLPGKDEVPATGYVAQTWIKQGQAIQMFRELRRGDLLVMGLVLLVGFVFVIASSMVHVMLRQRELSILAAVGWRTRYLLVLALVESAMVSLTGGTVAAIFYSRVQTVEAAGIAFLLYAAGATVATLATGVARPMRAMRSSGVTPNKQLAHVDSLFQMAWGAVAARQRNLLSLAALVLPTALLVVLTALSLRLEDRFFVTVLGSQVALQVGPFHYALMIAAFALAAATTADLMSLSVLERRGELALLSALGWRRGALRGLVLREGLLWGLVAGAAGAVIGLVVLFGVYGRVQPGLWRILPVIISIPTVTGLIGAVAPAESAARMQPGEGVKIS